MSLSQNSENMIWNAFYDYHNQEPAYAIQLLYFCNNEQTDSHSLSYVEATKIFNRNRNKGRIPINDNPALQSCTTGYKCICGHNLQQRKTDNTDITCDSCLTIIESGQIIYHCNNNIEIHKGGFDICLYCVNKQDSTQITLNPVQDQVQSFKTAFAQVSVNGGISKYRIREIEQFKDMSDTALDRFMNKYDTDNNGIIDFEEFCEFLKPFLVETHNETKGNYEQNTPRYSTPSLSSNYSNTSNNVLEMLLFNMFDDDGNGIVDAEELSIMLGTLGQDNARYGMMDTKYLIQKFDRNNKNGIDEDEFGRLLKYLKHSSSVDLMATFDNQISNDIFTEPDEYENKQNISNHISHNSSGVWHGWRVAYTKDHRMYYQNEITKQTTYERPSVMDQIPQNICGSPSVSKHNICVSPTVSVHGWRVAYTKDHRMYYQNEITKQTTFKRPAVMDRIHQKPIGHVQPSICASPKVNAWHGWWAAYTKDDRMYYQNDITRQTSWKRPAIMNWRMAYTKANKIYYQNDITRETSWDIPVNAQVQVYRQQKLKPNINNFDQWSSTDLSEWVRKLEIDRNDKQKLIWGIVEMQLKGDDFMSCNNAGDIADSFQEYNLGMSASASVYAMLVGMLSKTEWKNKEINQWDCNELQGWILNLGLENQTEQKLVCVIRENGICGILFNESFTCASDIIASFPAIVDKRIGGEIYKCLQNVRMNNACTDAYILCKPTYREIIPQSKMSQFCNTFYGKSSKLNVAAARCMKDLAYDLQCFINNEIKHKNRSKFDKLVGVYDSKRKFAVVINKLKKRLHWNNKIFKLFRELALFGLKICCNFILPGSSAIFHFVEAAKHYHNGDTKKALWSCSIGIATILTAGFFDEITQIFDALWGAVENTQFAQSIATKLKRIIKGLAHFLKYLLNGYTIQIKPFVDMINSKLSDFGITQDMINGKLSFLRHSWIVKQLCKFKIAIDELMQAHENDALDGYVTEQVNDCAKDTVQDCVKDNIGHFDDMKDAAEHFEDGTREKITVFVWKEMKLICKDKGIKLKMPIFWTQKCGKDSENECDYKEQQLSESEIANDKQRMVDEVGEFVSGICKSEMRMNGDKSEIKIFNINCDAMIFISITREINVREVQKKFKIKKEFEYKSKVHCAVMMAENDEAKTQFLIQKLVGQSEDETPGA